MLRNKKKPELKHDVSNDFYTLLGNVDIKYSGIPNVCFSLTDKDDDREKRFIQQRIKDGFDESETYNLQCTIANFIIPRLELYLKIAPSMIEVEQADEINSFLDAMKLVAGHGSCSILTDDEEQILEEGLQNFHKIFLGLWW